MFTKPKLSTRTIIFCVLLVSAALMTSVFIFHAKQKPTTAFLSENSLVFPAPREIKSFDLLTSQNKKVTRENFKNHWTLLFFGFTHCATICPVTLDMLNRVYTRLKDTYPQLQVLMVSLDPERDDADQTTDYVRGFNPNFIGVSGKLQEIRKLQSQFGIFSALDKSTGESNYQLLHTSSIMLIDPQGLWVGIFKCNVKPEIFAKAFIDSLHSLDV